MNGTQALMGGRIMTRSDATGWGARVWTQGASPVADILFVTGSSK